MSIQYDIDVLLDSLVTYFYHPDKIDAFFRGEIDEYDVNWEANEISLAAAGGDSSAVIPFGMYFSYRPSAGSYRKSNANLLPRWWLPWLIQRYNMINLCRYTKFSVRTKYREYPGDGEDVYKSTASAARDYGLQQSHIVEEDSIAFWPHLRLSYAYDRGWNCESIDEFIEPIRVFVPETMSGVPSAHYAGTFAAVSYYYNRYFPGFPGPGRVVFNSDENGVLTDLSGLVAAADLSNVRPSSDYDSITWGARDGSRRLYADWAPCFRFKPATTE